GVFAILSAHGDADFTGRQLEQAALQGRLDDALLAEGGVLAVAVDVVDAALRQLRQAEGVEAAFAQAGAAGRIIQQSLNGRARDVARLLRLVVDAAVLGADVVAPVAEGQIAAHAGRHLIDRGAVFGQAAAD